MQHSNKAVDKIVGIYKNLTNLTDEDRQSIKALFDELHKQYMHLLRFGKEENVPVYRRVLATIETMREHLTNPEVQLARREKRQRKKSSFLYEFFDKSNEDFDELEVLDNLIMGRQTREEDT